MPTLSFTVTSYIETKHGTQSALRKLMLTDLTLQIHEWMFAASELRPDPAMPASAQRARVSGSEFRKCPLNRLF